MAVNSESGRELTPVGVGAISFYMVVRSFRNSLAGASRGAVALGSSWSLVGPLWAAAEWLGHSSKRWNNASRRNAPKFAPCGPDVGRCDTENAAAVSGGSSEAGTVQCW